MGRDNPLHDQTSTYCIGWLQGATRRGSGLAFPKGAVWPLGFSDTDHARHLVDAIRRDPALPFDFRLNAIQLLRDPKPPLGTRHTFFAASPVLVRRATEDDRPADHVRFDEPDADTLLTRTFRSKLRAGGLPTDDVHVAFTPSPGARCKLVQIAGLDYRANLCPVTVEGSPSAVRFAWSAGMGALTGCGFGFLRPQ